jgi:hypothetical protein
MAIEGFDYQAFSTELASQAKDLVPSDFQDFQKNYIINTINNFAMLSGEAIYNDENLKFNAEQAMLVTQIIAEWSFHKSIDVIKSGILPDYWDGIMQKIAFTIFEVTKQAIIQGVSQDETLRIVEHHVKKTFNEVLTDLKKRSIIDNKIFERATKQSNIDEMMQQINEMQATQDLSVENQHAAEAVSSSVDSSANSKVLKLASVALLLKQVSEDKVQTILNKFDAHDAKTIIQYMKMPDLEQKLDQNITMRCLNEIRTNLPEPKHINPDKILFKMNKIFERHPKEVLDKITLRERPNIKEFITKTHEGETMQMPSKVASIIIQHLEENVS